MLNVLLSLVLTVCAAVSVTAHDSHLPSSFHLVPAGHKSPRNQHANQQHHKKYVAHAARQHGQDRTQQRRGTGTWTLAKRGVSGVSAQQLAIVDDDHAIIFDKVEHNPIKTKNGGSAWGSLYKFSTATARPLELTTNSFCAAGAFLGNGTLASLGGNAARADPDGSRWFNNTDGRQAIRLFTPCPDNENCQPYENINVHALLKPRWYPTSVRMTDGSMLVIGGCTDGGFTNDAAQNQASYEYFPRKGKSVIESKFLRDSLTANLFPHAFVIPSGEVFIAANTFAVLFNPSTKREQRLPDIPNGVRVCYPFSGSSLLLPLTPENNYTPEVLICGGSTIDDTRPPANLTSQIPASSQCVRMVLTTQGIKAGWKVEQMPQARHMHSMALLPTKQIVIVNGAQTGVSSYHSVQLQKGGVSNADHPTFQPVLYDLTAPAGSRFSSQNMPISDIARMYHSVASVTPSGEVMISGSNPNGDITARSEANYYPSELSVEILSPPYASMGRAKITALPIRAPHDQTFTVTITLSAMAILAAPKITVSLVDPGFSTHGVQMNTRLVGLELASKPNINGRVATLKIRSPRTPGIYPPGYGWLHVLVDGVPSPGRRILIGKGTVPAAY